MSSSVYQKIKFSDCGWKDDFYGLESHYLYFYIKKNNTTLVYYMN